MTDKNGVVPAASLAAPLPRKTQLRAHRVGAQAFTLVEMLVSIAALIVIMLVLFQAVNSSSSVWTRSVGKVQAFQAARSAFESITRNLTQSTLQGYYGYADDQGLPVPLINPAFINASVTLPRSKVVKQYLRQSELHFVSGPSVVAGNTNASLITNAGVNESFLPGHAIFYQAPVGFSDSSSYSTKPSLLNVCGYYVHFTSDAAVPVTGDSSQEGTASIPGFTSSLDSTPRPSFRYRLMEITQPAEQNGVYQSTNLLDTGTGLPTFTYDKQWIDRLVLEQRTRRHVLADNVIMLIVRPKLAPEDEERVVGDLGPGVLPPGGQAGDGSLIAPSYAYDSRSWEPGYNGIAIAPNAAKRPLVEKVIMNRLPPIVEVVMVALDERSGIRMSDRFGGSGGATPPLANSEMKTALGIGTRFTDATKFNQDMAALESGLNSLNLSYRIFRTEVRLPGAAFGE